MSDGSRVLVTGSSRGIGRAIAERLAADGFHVVLHCRSGLGALQESAQFIESAGGQCSFLQFDISKRVECRQVIEEDISRSGPYFGVVANAGLIRDGMFSELSPEHWDEVLRTNLDGFYNVLHPIVPHMVEAGNKGRIVALSSISGIVGNRGQVNYSASKAGIIGASKALSQELARRGITVNCVAPGLIKTEMTADLPLKQIIGHIPMRRLGRVEEVAGVVSFLLSKDASYVTGQVISVNGGMI